MYPDFAGGGSPDRGGRSEGEEDEDFKASVLTRGLGAGLISAFRCGPEASAARSPRRGSAEGRPGRVKGTSDDRGDSGVGGEGGGRGANPREGCISTCTSTSPDSSLALLLLLARGLCRRLSAFFRLQLAAMAVGRPSSAWSLLLLLLLPVPRLCSVT